MGNPLDLDGDGKVREMEYRYARGDYSGEDKSGASGCDDSCGTITVKIVLLPFLLTCFWGLGLTAEGFFKYGDPGFLGYFLLFLLFTAGMCAFYFGKPVARKYKAWKRSKEDARGDKSK